MLVRDAMTHPPVCCTPTDTIDTVAKLMLEHDCGEIPVCEGARLLGVITDRDITLRTIANGKSPMGLPVSDVMTRIVYAIRDDQPLAEAFDLMKEKLVRRLPVIDVAGKIVGILSQADLIAKIPTYKVARLLKNVAVNTRKEAH